MYVRVTHRGNASIVITGTRGKKDRRIVTVLGTVTHLDVESVQPYVRLARETAFRPAVTSAAVGDEGRFRWQRDSNQRITINVTARDVRSSRVTVGPR